jgi:hypothetical protein
VENARVFGVSQKATAVGTGVIVFASVRKLKRLYAFTPATTGSGRFVVAVLCALLRGWSSLVVSLK